MSPFFFKKKKRQVWHEIQNVKNHHFKKQLSSDPLSRVNSHLISCVPIL